MNEPAAPGATGSVMKGGPLTGSGGAAPAEETPEQAARRKEAEEISGLLKERKFDEAEKRLKAEIEKNPDDSGAWYFLAGAYRLQDKYEDAIVAYTKCAELMPDYGDTYLRRGISWFHKGEYGIAVFDFEQAGSLNYFDPRPELWKGLAIASLDQHRLAISAYSTAIKYEARFVPAYVNRGLSYMIMDDYLAAIINFNEAIRLEPQNPEHYFLRGIAFVKSRQDDRAVVSYDAAIRLDPKYADAYLNRSICLARQGKTAEAARDRETALKLKPALASIDPNARPVPLPQSSDLFRAPLR
ncbi:MAG: tetratricopeptide repeat protein [Pirellulales bacterium]